MKTRKLLMLVASVGLIFGMMTGCGGGSSDGGDGGDGGTPTPSTGFSPEKIDTQVAAIAEQLGCEYAKNVSVQDTKQGIALTLKTTKIIVKVIQDKKDIPLIAESQTHEGSCGGSVTINEETGETSLSYSFVEYCMGDEDTGIEVRIDGSLALSGNEAGDRITASTPTPLTVKSNNPNTGENVSVTVDLDSATLSANEDGSMKIDITELTVKDNNAGKTYGVRSFVANINLETSDMDFHGILDNPNLDVGSLNVNGTIDGSTREGHVTATDANGVKVELITTGTEGILDVIYDGAPQGKMDCSMADMPI